MARAGAAMFVAGGALALLSLAVPHWPVRHLSAAAVVAALAVVAGMALYASARYFVPWVAHVLLAGAAVQVAVGIQFVGPGAGSVSAGGMYVWMAIYAFYFFSWRAALGHLGVMALAYGLGRPRGRGRFEATTCSPATAATSSRFSCPTAMRRER